MLSHCRKACERDIDEFRFAQPLSPFEGLLWDVLQVAKCQLSSHRPHSNAIVRCGSSSKACLLASCLIKRALWSEKLGRRPAVVPFREFPVHLCLAREALLRESHTALGNPAFARPVFSPLCSTVGSLWTHVGDGVGRTPSPVWNFFSTLSQSSLGAQPVWVLFPRQQDTVLTRLLRDRVKLGFFVIY